MKDPKNKDTATKVILSTTAKDELIVLLQKVHNDYSMLDSKMKEILNSNNIDTESLGNALEKLKETNKDLNEYAEIRNKKFEELLKTIKN